jgi:tetratricopeptide (TPR) repeat protein
MPDFAKAFVSHSSADKPLVERVAGLVSAARWEIDSHTFEEGKSSAAEIFEALSRSDLFVLIASAKSMASTWVKSELELAQHMLYSKKLGAVLVFIIDGTSAEELPEWIRMHVFIRTSNETRIANLIRSRLVQLDSAKGIQEKPFVQRIRIRGDIERRIADLNHQIRALYVSGVDGIGRHSIVSNTLRSLFPGMDLRGIEISIADGEGLLEAFRKLYFAWERPTIEEAKRFFDDTVGYTKQQLIEKTNELLNAVSEQKMFAWLQFDYEILDDDGNLQPEFHELFRSLKTRRPTVVVCAKRSPRFQEQRRLDNIGFFKVESLTDEESKLLWIYALDHLQFADPEPKFVAFLQEHVSGHPAMIWTAAEYVAAMGQAATQADPRELLETLRGLSLSLVDGLHLNVVSKRLLALFDEFGAVDPTDLIEICNESDQAVAEAVTRLISLGLLESEGEHLKLASYFRSARFRKQFASETDSFLVEARRRLLGLTSTYNAEDNISFATIDVALTNAIAQGKNLPLELGERAVVGSHYLRVARGCYDREKYGDTVIFASQALAKRYTLTNEAVVECLRLLGMAAVRTNDKDSLSCALAELSKIGTHQSRRHVHFIKGFDARWNGFMENAEAEFGETLKINPKDTHALREIAQLQVMREDYASAERFARDALERNPGNPFVIDILLNCLIERRKDNHLDLLEDDEIHDLFAQLDVADRRERSDFTDLRQAHYFSALKNFSEAIKWADSAVRKNPGQVRAHATRAEIKMRMKNDPKALHSVETDIAQIQKIADESNGVRTHVGLLAKLRIRFELAKGNTGAAIRLYESAPWAHGQMKRKLALEIAGEVMDRGIKDPDQVVFANRALASK